MGWSVAARCRGAIIKFPSRKCVALILTCLDSISYRYSAAFMPTFGLELRPDESAHALHPVIQLACRLLTRRCMFSPIRAILLITIFCFALVNGARALDLATFQIIDQGGGLGDMTSLQITIQDQPVGPGGQPTYQLGDYLLITPADVGKTFTLTAATDVDFTIFRQTVTNGIDDPFGYFVQDLPAGSGVGTGWNEANLFAPGTHAFGPGSFTSIGQLSGPDFAGYDIGAVLLTIDFFSLGSGGGFNTHDFRATATIVTVPEASTVIMPLLITALLAAGAWFRSLKKAKTGGLDPETLRWLRPLKGFPRLSD